MDTSEFARYLKRGGRSPAAVARCLAHLADFGRFLEGSAPGTSLAEATAGHLGSYVESVESEPGRSAKNHLWALHYWFQFVGAADLASLAVGLRHDRIDRRPLRLSALRYLTEEVLDRLAAVDIGDVAAMLAAGATRRAREELAGRTGLPLATIVELVQLSNLARIPGVKGIRARLYHRAGVTSVADLAEQQPEELCERMVRHVAETGFDGVAPLPAETRHAVATARSLPTLVEW